MITTLYTTNFLWGIFPSLILFELASLQLFDKRSAHLHIGEQLDEKYLIQWQYMGPFLLYPLIWPTENYVCTKEGCPIYSFNF